MDKLNDNNQIQDSNPVSGNGNMPDDKSEQASRRTFLRRVGTVLFSALIVDATVEQTKGSCTCGNGTTDILCYVVPEEMLRDPDANCGFFPSGADTDQSCSSLFETSTDLNCGKGPNHSDTDQACDYGIGPDTDQNCYIEGPARHDPDQHCTRYNNDTDQACGDCNDSHDSDEHCDVSGDQDNMCGHQHQGTWIDTDDACTNHTGVVDAGCGVHNNGFNDAGPVTDTDNNCGDPIPDQNCTGLVTGDAACEPQQWSSQPDESCSQALSKDEACMKYFDSDENCTLHPDVPGGDSDEHCNHGTFPDIYGHDSDEHCGAPNDTDEACRPPGDEDNSPPQ